MAPPTVLPLYAGLLGALFLALSVNVIRLRRRFRISLGGSVLTLLAAAIQIRP